MLESFVVILGIICFLGVLSVRAFKPFDPPKTQPFSDATVKSFVKVDSVFVNAPERIFFQMLETRLPREFRLLTKVRLEDIVRVAPNIKTPKQRWQLRGRVKSRHVDFLIIRSGGQPIAVIELDGSSHSAKTATADALKNGIFSAVDLPLYRVKVGSSFADHIETIIANLPK